MVKGDARLHCDLLEGSRWNMKPLSGQDGTPPPTPCPAQSHHVILTLQFLCHTSSLAPFSYFLLQGHSRYPADVTTPLSEPGVPVWFVSLCELGLMFPAPKPRTL